MPDSPVRVGILYGGPSAEHDVSCASAMSVVRALPRGCYEPVPIGVTREGRFIVLAAERVAAAREGVVAGGSPIEDRLELGDEEVLLLRGRKPGRAALATADAPLEAIAELDVVFPLLHGPFGEDGIIQGKLETLGVPYVGCGVLGSAVGMDKVAMKRAFRAEGLPLTPYAYFDEDAWCGHADPRELVSRLRYPLFVKPANMGSSIGISRVTCEADVADAVEAAFAHDHFVVVEQGVSAVRELECGVLGGLRPAASVPGEVQVEGDWFDYQLKYFGESDPMIVPAELPDQVIEEVRSLSVRAFEAVGAWGLARVDFLYDEPAGRLYVNELNTMPGFTAFSMYPKVWAAMGVPYAELVMRLLALAFERHRLMQRRNGRVEVRA